MMKMVYIARKAENLCSLRDGWSGKRRLVRGGATSMREKREETGEVKKAKMYHFDLVRDCKRFAIA
jgi:hypothetical protein